MSTPAQPVVLHLISSLRVGGAERLLVSTMREAAKAGQTGFVVVIMNDECDQGLVAELESTGVPLYRLGRREGHLSPKYLTAILNIIRRHGATVIHTHNEGSRSWGMLAKLARPRLRLVYTVHAEGVGATITGLRRAAYLRLVDTTVAISEAVERECRAFGAKDVVRIENGVDLEAFAAVRRPRDATARPRLISVARFQPVKGQDILIEALGLCTARGHRLPLTLVGAGAAGPFFEKLVSMIAERGMTPDVTFAIDRTDIPDLLRTGDIFVLPSRQEGFGLALIEAMAAGLPVIASRTGGPATLVADRVNGLTFTPEEPEDLAEKIITLATDADLCATLVKAGYDTAARFSIAATLAAHRDLYCRLAR